ncbi:hypothetical protein CBR_g54079, partial [Chara braunii]
KGTEAKGCSGMEGKGWDVSIGMEGMEGMDEMDAMEGIYGMELMEWKGWEGMQGREWKGKGGREEMDRWNGSERDGLEGVDEGDIWDVMEWKGRGAVEGMEAKGRKGRNGSWKRKDGMDGMKWKGRTETAAMDSPEAADDPGLLETNAFYEAQLSSEQWLLCQSDAPFERRTLERESASLGMNKDLLEAIQRLQAQCDQLAQEKSEIEDMLVCEQLQHNKAVAEMGAEIATLRRSLADCETRILSLELQVDGFSLDDGKEVELDGFDDDAPKLRSTSRAAVDGRFFPLRSSGEQDKDGLLAECERLRTELARSEAARFEMHRQLEESKQLRALVMEEDGPLKDKLVTMMSRMGEGELQVTRGSDDGSRCGDDGDETLRSYEDKAVEADVWPEHWTHLESTTPRTPKDMYGRVQALLELGEESLNDVGPEEEAQLRARLEEAERSKTKWQEEAQALESALRDRGERIVILEEELREEKVKVVAPSAAFTEDERVWEQEVDSLHRVLKDQEHRIAELEAELREEKAKARLDADDFAQQMTDLRLEMSEIVDEEKWRRSQAEDISVRRVKELENELDVAQKERTAALADKRAAQELMEKREQSRIEAESKVSMLEKRLKEEWDQASKAEERVRVLEELLQGKDEIKGLDIVEVKLAREKLAREKAEAELKLAKALEDCEALRLSVREVCAERDRMASDVVQLQRSLDDSGSTTAKLVARMERLEEELLDLKEKEEGSGQREQEWEQEKEQRERLTEEMAERVKEMEGAAERARQAEERFEELQKELGERDVKIASLTEEVKMRMEVVEAKVQLAQELEQVKEEKLALETELSLVSERSKVWEDMVNEHDVSDDGVSSTMNEVLRKWQREVLENQRMAKELSEVEKVCQGMKEEKAIATRMFGKALESVCKDLIILLKLLLEEGDEAKKAEALEPHVGRAQRLGSSLASHRSSGGDVKVDLSQAMSELVDVVGQGLAAARKEVSECRSAFTEKEVAMQSTRRAMETELVKVRDDLEAEKIEDRTALAKPVEKMIDRVAGEMLHVLHVIEQVNLTAGSKVELPESMEERISRIMGSSSILRGSSSLEDGGKVFSGWLADLLTEFTDVSVKIGVLTRKQLGSLRDRLEDLRDEHETVRSEQERLFAEYERLQSEEKAARIAENPAVMTAGRASIQVKMVGCT